MNKPVSRRTWPEDAIRTQLKRVLGHPEFRATDRMREFLRYVVEETLAGNAGQLKGFTIATKVFGRGPEFDPAQDPVVRIQAGRLRQAIERYYLVAGADDPVRIDIPKGGYVPVFSYARLAGSVNEAKSSPPMVDRDGWPSVLVLPFENMAVDTELAYLGRGLATELCLGLAQCPEFRVMLADDEVPVPAEDRSDPDFIVRGNIRRRDSELKVVAQLLDASTGEQLWIDSLKTATTDVDLIEFPERVAAAVTARIAGQQGVISRWLSRDAMDPLTESTTTYQAILKGFSYHQKADAEGYRLADEALRCAYRDGPECALVCSLLAVLYIDNVSMEFMDLRRTPVAEAVRMARDGARLDPDNQFTRLVLARVHLLDGDLAAGLEEADAALALNPRSLLFKDVIGYMLTLLGDWERGEALVREAMRENPYYRRFVHYATWLNAFRLGDYERALAETRRLAGVAFFWDPLARAATLAKLRRRADARAAIRELLALKGDFRQRGRILISRYIKFPELQEVVVDGLAYGGLQLDAVATQAGSTAG